MSTAFSYDALGLATGTVQPSTVDLSRILIKAIAAVLQVLSMASIGILFTKLKIIDPNVRKAISVVSMNVAIPCLLFSSLLDCKQGGKAQDPSECPPLVETISSAWVFLLLPTVWVSLGLFAGRVAAAVGAAPDHLRNTAVAACGFPNSTGLPITLLSALSRVSFGLPGESQSLRGHRFLLLLSLYQITYPVLQWSLGGWFLSARETVEADREMAGTSQCEMPVRSQSCLTIRAVLRAALVPPVIGVLLGFVLAIHEPIRSFIVDTRDFDNDGLFEWLFNAIQAFGNAAVPMNMLVLGSSLASTPSCSAINWRLTLSVVFSKLVLHPTLAFLTITLLRTTGILSSVVDVTLRSHVIVVACLLAATPTANNLAVMAELAAGLEAKQFLATTIFVMYCIAPVVLTSWIVLFIAVAQA
eukprot:TRINITY_DN19086_c0_g1_i1.p1 TRINITY_DN19086_c0_g1~~TRINITY_DN19086_c0_g1_i1.p1  ORF type:complete len:415 (-),score=42.33 TRINITY_DN19086_c0_g1_i1:98-1342(-)